MTVFHVEAGDKPGRDPRVPRVACSTRFLSVRSDSRPLDLKSVTCSAGTRVGSGKDIGQDKPAFGWELEPLEPLVLFSDSPRALGGML